MKQSYIAVVGGVNVDIAGTPDTRLLPGDSNPGRVTVTLGGVGRNIAENIRRLGRPVELVTALGGDSHALQVRQSCRELGIGLSHSLVTPDGRTSTYLCMNDVDGDMVAAIADMAICDRLTPAFLESQLDMLNGAGLVVLDANLTEESLVYLAKHVTAPLAADPVSVKKAVKLQSALPCLSLLKPNRPEASCLTGVPIGSHADLPLAAEAFFRLGLKNVFISLGSEGVYFHDGRESGIVPCFHAPIVNTSGCGDAFLAASAIAWADGCSLREAARRGQAAAAVCAGFAGAVNPNMSAAALDNLLKGDKTP